MTDIKNSVRKRIWTQADLKEGDIFTGSYRREYFLYVDALTVIQLDKPECSNTIGDLVDLHEPLNIVKTLEVTEWK